MIDRNEKTYPDLKGILKTCQRNITQSELQQITNSFKCLYQTTLKNGELSESDLQNAGFSSDQDQYGLDLTKDATIAQEHRQRAKCLTHEHQIHLRQERILSLKNEMMRKKQEAKDKLREKNRRNKDAMTKLKDFMNQETLNLEDATLQHFSKLKLCYLEAFILVRTIETKNKLPKKGNFGRDYLARTHLYFILMTKSHRLRTEF